jgi:outer membrane protein assembly complex protein YaeT
MRWGILRFLVKTRKRMILFLSFLLLVAAVVIVSFIVNSSQFKRYVLARANAYLTNEYNLSISADDIQFNLLRLSIVINGVQVEPSVSGASFLELGKADRIVVNFPLTTIFSKKLHIQKLIINKPQVVISQLDANEKRNRATISQQPELFQIDELNITDGELTYKNNKYNAVGFLYNISARIHYSSKSHKHIGKVKTSNGKIIFSQLSKIIDGLHIDFAFDDEEITVENLALDSQSTNVKISGQLKNYMNRPHYSFQLSSSLLLEEYKPLFSPGYEYKGKVLVKTKAEGEGSKYDVTGELKGEGITVHDVLIDSFKAAFKGDQKALLIKRFETKLADGDVNGRLNINLIPKRTYLLSLQWNALNISKMAQQVPHFPLPISSESKGKLEAQWSGLNLDQIDAEGDISFDSSAIAKKKAIEQNTLDGQLSFEVKQGKVEFHQSTLSINKNTLTFSGFIDNNKKIVSNFILQSEDISTIEKLLTQLNSTMKIPLLQNIPELNLAGGASVSGDITGSLQKPAVSLNIEGYEIKTLQYAASKVKGALLYENDAMNFNVTADNIRIENEDVTQIEAEGNFKNNSLCISNLRVVKENAVLQGNLSIDFSSKYYSLDIEGEKINLKNIKYLKPGKNGIDGIVDLKLKGSGTLEHPRLSLQLSSERLAAFNIQVQQVNFYADLKDDTVKYSLKIPEGETEIEGVLQLKGDYLLKGVISCRNARAEHIIQDAEQKLTPEFSGELSADVSYSIPLKEWQNLTARIKMDKARIKYQELAMQNSRPILVEIEKGRLKVKDFSFSGSNTEFNIYGELPLNREDESAVRIDGAINLQLFQPFIKDSKISGVLSIKSELKGSLIQPKLSADIDLVDGVFAYPLVPYRIHDISFHAIAEDNYLKMERFIAKIDEGTISLQGGLLLDSLLFKKPQNLIAPEAKDRNDIEIVFSNINIGTAAHSFAAEFLKEAGGLVDGKLHIQGNFYDMKQLEIDGQLNKVFISLSQLALQNKETIHFNLGDGILFLKGMELSGEESSIQISGQTELIGKKNLNAHISAQLNSALLAPFLTAVIPGGSSSWELFVNGTINNPLISGVGKIVNGFFQLKDFPITANDVNGKIELSKNMISVSSLQGNINGGPFSLTGNLKYIDNNIESINMSLSANNVRLNYPEGLISQTNANLTLEKKKREKEWTLAGKIELLQAFYGKDIYPGSQLLSAIRSRQTKIIEKGVRGFPGPNLDITISTLDSIVIDNNMANLELTGNIRVTGTMDNPIFSGRVTNRYTGELKFAEHTYEIEKAAIDFLGTEEFDPYLDIVAHTNLKYKYDELEVKLTLYGPLSNINYSLSSFPPCSQEELASLLITGRSFEDIKSDTANIIGNQMLMYFSSPIASPVTQRLEKLLKIEEVKIEPINIASEEDPGARFTFSKQVSDEVELTYSIDVSNSQNQTWILDYNLNRNFAIRSFRKDDGSYGSSFRHRVILGSTKGELQKRAAAQKERLIIKEIKLEGDLIFPQKMLEKRIRLLKEGSFFDYLKLRRTIENIIKFYKMNNYLNIVVSPSINYEEEGIVKITIEISPAKPISILFSGDSVDKDVSSKIIAAWDGRLPMEITLKQSEDLILKNLHSAGYYDAHVRCEKKEQEEKIIIIFYLDKGLPYVIRKCTILGNSSIKSEAIIKVIKELPGNKDMGLWTLVYNFAQAKEVVESFYHDNGFLSAVVKQPEVIPDRRNKCVDLNISIDEGPQSLVYSVELQGNKIFSDIELKKNLQLVEKSIYRPPLLTEDKNHIINLYKRKGYQDVEIEAEVVQFSGANDYTLLYKINEGIQHTIDAIEIIGNQKTADYIILKELKFKKGDVLNLEKFSKSQKSLYDIGVFKSVNIYPQPSGAVRGKDKAVIEVQEEANYAIAYGLRYDSEVKFEGFGELNLYNVFGRGRSGVLYYRQSDREKNLRFSLKEPYLFGRKLNSLYSLYYLEETKASFKTEEIGFSFQQQRKLPHDFSLSYLYKLHRIHTYELEPVGPFVFDITLFLSELSTFIVRDTRDNKMDSHRGSFFSLSFTYSPEFLGSYLTYISLFGQYSIYKALKPDFVWASNYRIGLADAFAQVLIPSKRFYAGGGNSIRGFELDSVGPIDPYLGTPEGGESLFIMNQELRFPIYKWIRGVAFYDMGNVYLNLSDFNPFKSRHSIGFGLRLDTPVSLIRLDCGVNLFPRLGEPGAVFFFSIGQAF